MSRGTFVGNDFSGVTIDDGTLSIGRSKISANFEWSVNVLGGAGSEISDCSVRTTRSPARRRSGAGTRSARATVGCIQ